MLKLYRLTDERKEYWETWENDDGTHTVHWGELGDQGYTRTVKSTLFKKAAGIVQKEMDARAAEGFKPYDIGLHCTLIIEYAVEGMGTQEDLDKRYQLEERLNQTLGWTGLGHCDGGSIGSGTMEVYNYVIDFDIARKIVEQDLSGTAFSNYTRIYDENEDLGETMQ